VKCQSGFFYGDDSHLRHVPIFLALLFAAYFLNMKVKCVMRTFLTEEKFVTGRGAFRQSSKAAKVEGFKPTLMPKPAHLRAERTKMNDEVSDARCSLQISPSVVYL
jgi:hypothetical protein